MTIRERRKPSQGHIAWVGDGNNVLHDLMLASAMAGYDMVYATPEGMAPDPHVLERAIKIADSNGASIRGTIDPREAVADSGVIYTDVFISMGEENLDGKADLFQASKLMMSLYPSLDRITFSCTVYLLIGGMR